MVVQFLAAGKGVPQMSVTCVPSTVTHTVVCCVSHCPNGTCTEHSGVKSNGRGSTWGLEYQLCSEVWLRVPLPLITVRSTMRDQMFVHWALRMSEHQPLSMDVEDDAQPALRPTAGIMAPIREIGMATRKLKQPRAARAHPGLQLEVAAEDAIGPEAGQRLDAAAAADNDGAVGQKRHRMREPATVTLSVINRTRLCWPLCQGAAGQEAGPNTELTPVFTLARST